MIEIETGFGERLKSERLRLGLSQEELAAVAGMKPLAILNYEKNKSSPTLKTLYAFGRKGVNLSYLVLGQTWLPNIKDFPPEVIKTVCATLKKLETLLENAEGLTDTARINATLILLQEVARISEEEPNLEDVLLKTLITEGIGT